MTTKCVDLLLSKFGQSDISIIIVDNGSKNGSGELLEKYYSGIESVHVLQLEENQGFAKGNNAGYSYALSNFEPDFVVVMNNDVLIEDVSFLAKITKEYNASAFAVLGPDIYSPKADTHQSPIHLHPISIDEACKERNAAVVEYERTSFWRYYYRHITWNIKLQLGLAKRSRTVPGKNENYLQPHTGCVLHGACYIFSRDFFNKRKYAFNPSTFLFVEEHILAFECQRDGLVMRYTPNISVTHLEDVSTNTAIKYQRRRMRMKLKNSIHSLDILINMMDGR